MSCLHGQQSLGDESGQRVLDRAARHPELGSEVMEAELLSGRGPSCEDPFPKLTVDLVVDRSLVAIAIWRVLTCHGQRGNGGYAL